MRSKVIILVSIFISAVVNDINAQKGNPYSDIGKKGEILTLSNGQFDEFFDEEDVQQIGTNLVNIRTMKVVKVLTEDEAEKKLDNTTGKRFLSVDPLTKSYPFLTPYQYASNRPIDGTDLDGKEWDKAVSYDIMKGEFKVQLSCKIKITCAANMSGDAKAIGEAFISEFENSFNNLYDERRKIKYSATAEYEILNGESQSSDYVVDLFTSTKADGKPFVAGIATSPNTQSNFVSVASATKSKNTGEVTVRDPKVVAQTIIHEAGHTGNVPHPFDDDNNASDVDLTPSTQNINGKQVATFVVSPGADKNKVLSNVMMYGTTTINGVKVSDIIKDPAKLNKFSAEQAFLILQQIMKDKKEQPAQAPTGTSTNK